MNNKKPDVIIDISEQDDLKKIPPELAISILESSRDQKPCVSQAINEQTKQTRKFKRSRPVFWWNILLNELGANKNPLYNNGIHYLDGPTGSGKTLVMNIAQQTLTSNKGFMWSAVDEFYSDKIKVFDMYDIWKDGKMQYKLPHFLPGLGGCKGMIFDEINRIFNRRLNRLNIYNDVFIPLVNSMVTHRHLRIPRIYFIGQALELQDVQLQLIIRYQHLIQSKKRYYYYFWKKDLILIKAPYKIKVTHMIKDKTKEKFIPFGKTIFKVSLKDLLSYNTYGFETDTNNLPVYTAFH